MVTRVMDDLITLQCTSEDGRSQTCPWHYLINTGELECPTTQNKCDSSWITLKVAPCAWPVFSDQAMAFFEIPLNESSGWGLLLPQLVLQSWSPLLSQNPAIRLTSSSTGQPVIRLQQHTVIVISVITSTSQGAQKSPRSHASWSSVDCVSQSPLWTWMPNHNRQHHNQPLRHRTCHHPPRFSGKRVPPVLITLHEAREMGSTKDSTPTFNLWGKFANLVSFKLSGKVEIRVRRLTTWNRYLDSLLWYSPPTRWHPFLQFMSQKPIPLPIPRLFHPYA